MKTVNNGHHLYLYGIVEDSICIKGFWFCFASKDIGGINIPNIGVH